MTDSTDANGAVIVTAATQVAPEELDHLYRSVGWMAYADNPEMLQRAIAGSSFVVLARRDGRLIGLARAISDGASICYLQDVLVTPDEQRHGVGALLVQAVLQRFDGVRQKVVLTDDEAAQRGFYEALGYADIHDFKQGTLRAFVRFD